MSLASMMAVPTPGQANDRDDDHRSVGQMPSTVCMRV